MRADFYVISKPRFIDDPLLLVCILAQRCYDSGSPTLILARDEEQAEALDDLLWSFRDDVYLPHQIAGRDEEDEVTPLLIAAPDVDPADRPMIINLRDAAFFGQCERVLEVVPADDSAREPLRERWRAYRDRQFEMHKHDM